MILNIHACPFNNHACFMNRLQKIMNALSFMNSPEFIMKYTYEIEIHEQMHEKQRKHLLKLFFFSFIYKNK